MITYPGLPGPIICDFLSREASRERYAPGTEFQIGRIELVSNTGTYVDTPFHRYADGDDLARQPLRPLAGRRRWWCVRDRAVLGRLGGATPSAAPDPRRGRARCGRGRGRIDGSNDAGRDLGPDHWSGPARHA